MSASSGKHKPSKGVLIIAAGHPYYGQLALNLCLSMKYSSPVLPVTLAVYGNGAGRIQPFKHMFDSIIDIPEEYVTTSGGKNMVKPKVYADKLSPYDETMFVDADVIWHPHRGPDKLMDELKDIDFTIGNRNLVESLDTRQSNIVQWAEPQDLAAALDHTGRFYNLSSEFMYFKKGDVTTNVFETARGFFDNPGITYKRFAGGVPDELAFQMALAVLDMAPHQVPYLPFYWEHQQKKMMKPRELYAQYWGFSVGGNHTGDYAKKIYNNLAAWYHQQWGLRFTNPLVHKRDILPERQFI